MTTLDFECALEALEAPTPMDYSEDQEASCICLTCHGSGEVCKPTRPK